MKLHHMITEKPGIMGGRSFVVHAQVVLTDEEEGLRKAYGVYDTLQLGERFKDLKGTNALGDMSLASLLGRQLEIKVATIQMAADLVRAIRTSLDGVKGQIHATAQSVANLNQQFDVDIE
jgi:hypothetical protein